MLCLREAPYSTYLATGRLNEEFPAPISFLRPDRRQTAFIDYMDPATRHLVHLGLSNDWKVSYAYLTDLRDLVIKKSRASKDTSESEMIQTEREKPSDNEKARSTTLISNTVVHFLGRPGTAGRPSTRPTARTNLITSATCFSKSNSVHSKFTVGRRAAA